MFSKYSSNYGTNSSSSIDSNNNNIHVSNNESHLNSNISISNGDNSFNSTLNINSSIKNGNSFTNLNTNSTCFSNYSIIQSENKNSNNNNTNNNNNKKGNANNNNGMENLEEDDEDIDSLNINFDDVNDQSDSDDYYIKSLQNSSNQSTIKNLNHVNGNVNKNTIINGKNDMDSHHYSSHHLNTKMSTQKNSVCSSINMSYNNCSYLTSPSSSIIDASNDDNNSNEPGYSSSTKTPANRNIHCAKEKIRRDRIKISCNQLRRLIPSVNGFKTDMASLLETCVLWTQLVNSNVPEEYLNSIKTKMETFASFKPNLVAKNPNLISSNLNATFLPLAASSSISKNDKFKTSYDYLISKSQSDNQLQMHHQHQMTAHHHHHHHHQQQQQHQHQQQMSMQIKSENMSPAFLKSCQPSSTNDSSTSSSINNVSNSNGSTLNSSLPPLLPKPATWSSHLYSFQTSENINANNNCLTKNTASNSQQLSYNHQYL
jgi:hypothetical protein